MATLTLAAPARAEVVGVDATGFRIVHRVATPLAPAAAWERLVAVGTWWSDDHTYSGAAANMTIAPVAGGCFCEAWPGGSIAHGQVLLAISGSQLRLDAPLGPLQGMPVSTVLNFTIAADGEGSTLTMTFLVAGASDAAFAELAPLVDAVLGEQMTRFANVR